MDHRSLSSAQEYEDLLSAINTHVTKEGMELARFFEIFSKTGGIVTMADLVKTL